MTPNEQVKAIAEKYEGRLEFHKESIMTGENLTAEVWRTNGVEVISEAINEALSQQPTVTAEELAKNLTENYFPDELMRSGAIQMILRGISIATAPLQSEVTQLRKELAIAEEAARLGKLSIHEQFLATNKMAETIVENQRLTAEVERLEQELYQRYVSWTTELGNEVEPFEEWKASRRR